MQISSFLNMLRNKTTVQIVKCLFQFHDRVDTSISILPWKPEQGGKIKYACLGVKQRGNIDVMVITILNVKTFHQHKKQNQL